jgi:uncharacterized membrane protein
MVHIDQNKKSTNNKTTVTCLIIGQFNKQLKGDAMKKYVLTIIFLLFCVCIYAAETADIKVSFDYPRNIKSNGKTLSKLEITNRREISLYDLELLFTNDDNLEIVADKTKIDKLDPKETITINMEIINNYKYYFSKKTVIRLKTSNSEFSINDSYSFTIKPVENFWLFMIISITVILTAFFVFIFIKLNKGEENVR